tara:strand:- start:171 stop:323 length:153 start_codon:yes stop_codon:yes gene_type:complete
LIAPNAIHVDPAAQAAGFISNDAIFTHYLAFSIPLIVIFNPIIAGFQSHY